MKLGKLLSVGEISEQPPVEEPQAAPAEHGSATARAGAAAGAGDRAQAPALTRAGR
jgi:hypothetical protein